MHPFRSSEAGAAGERAALGAAIAAIACCLALPLLAGAGVLTVSGALLRNAALLIAGLVLAGAAASWLLTRRRSRHTTGQRQRHTDPSDR
jgi:hypothetical protein